MKNIILNNKKEIPIIGYGTWLIEDQDAASCVYEAIKLGYNHIDTAQVYYNERGVGEGIKRSGISRDKLFITSKIDADIKDYHLAKKSIEESLKKLDVEYIDLMLIHAPTKWDDDKPYYQENVLVYKALEEAVEEGKIKSIGISNFKEKDIDNILAHCKIKPTVNQIQIHIGHTPLELIEYCKKYDIVLEAFSPLGHGTILEDPLIIEMAKKYHTSPALLAIQYTLELGCVTLPKAKDVNHMKENISVDFHIEKEDMVKLISLVLPDWDVE